MHPLTIVGTVLEGIGILIAVGAFYRTVRGYGEYPWTVPLRASRSAIGRSAAWLRRTGRRLLRRPGDPVVVTPEPVTISLTMGRPSVRTGYRRLTGLWDHEARLLELADRTADLRLNIDDGVEALTVADEALGERVNKLEAQLRREIARVRGERTNEVLRDSRWQFGGLLVVVAGIALNAVGQALQAT